MKSSPKYTECPKCQSRNIHTLSASDAWFCLDCDWDDLPAVTGTNDPLINALRHGDLNARREAAQALINIGDTDRHLATADDLTLLLQSLDDADDDVRYFATVALGKLGDAGALERLRVAVQNDPSELVRQGALTAIERLES
jgi:HEAT repeat protein